MMFITDIEFIFRFIFPIIILIGLLIGYFLNPEFFEKHSLTKPVISLLTIGAVTTSFINIVIFNSPKLALAINFGSVIIPIILSLFFIYKLRSFINIFILIILVFLISSITYLLAYVDPGVGIVIDFPFYLIPVLFSVVFSVLMPKNTFSNSHSSSQYNEILISYSICTLGIFIGSDILRLPTMLEQRFNFGFLGGLGVFDLIFVSGMFAIAFSILLHPFLPKSNISITQRTKRTLLEKDKKLAKIKTSYIGIGPLASLKARMAAFGIDLGIQFGLFSIILIIIIKDQPGQITDLIFNLNITRGEEWIMFLGWVWIVHITYFILFEWYLGQTPGKMIMNIKVIVLPLEMARKQKINSSGQRNKFICIFARNIIRLTDLLFGFFIISIYLIIQTKKSQRIGDFFASTMVIKGDHIPER